VMLKTSGYFTLSAPILPMPGFPWSQLCVVAWIILVPPYYAVRDMMENEHLAHEEIKNAQKLNTSFILINNPDLETRARRFNEAPSCTNIIAYRESILQHECPQLSETAQGIRGKLNLKTVLTMLGAASHAGASVGNAVGSAVGESASAVLTVDNAEVTVAAFKAGTGAAVSGVTNTAVTHVAGKLENSLDPATALQNEILRTNTTYTKAKTAWTAGSILLIAAAVVGDVLSGGLSAGALTASALSISAAGGIAFSLADGVSIVMQTAEVNNLRDCFNTICVFGSDEGFELASNMQSTGNNSVGRCDCKGKLDWYGSCTNPYGFRSSCTQWQDYGNCEVEEAYWSGDYLCQWSRSE